MECSATLNSSSVCFQAGYQILKDLYEHYTNVCTKDVAVKEENTTNLIWKKWQVKPQVKWKLYILCSHANVLLLFKLLLKIQCLVFQDCKKKQQHRGVTFKIGKLTRTNSPTTQNTVCVLYCQAAFLYVYSNIAIRTVLRVGKPHDFYYKSEIRQNFLSCNFIREITKCQTGTSNKTKVSKLAL